MSEDGWEIQQKMGIPLSYTYLENHVGTTVYLWQLPADEILMRSTAHPSPPALCLQRLHIPEKCWVKWAISSLTKTRSWTYFISSANGVKSWIERSMWAARLSQQRRRKDFHFSYPYLATSEVFPHGSVKPVLSPRAHTVEIWQFGFFLQLLLLHRVRSVDSSVFLHVIPSK